jgi:hypothetical protein
MRRRKQTNNKTPVESGELAYDYKYVNSSELHTDQVAEMWQPPAELASGQAVREQKKIGVAELPSDYPKQEQKVSLPVELDSRSLR